MANNLNGQNFNLDKFLLKFTVVDGIFAFYAGDNEYGEGFYKSVKFSNKSFICSMFPFYYELSFWKNRNEIFYLA